MTGPIVTCASGNKVLTAYASKWAAECRITPSPSASFAVMMDKGLSVSIRKLVSTTVPFTFPAKAALAKPEPIEEATSATVTGPG